MNPNGAAEKGKRTINADPSGPFQHLASPNILPPNTQLHFAPPTLPPNTHFSQVQQILNNAAPKKPFSYMSLLTAPDEDDDVDPLFKDINSQCAQIDHMISLHSENMKQVLGQHLHDVHREAEERAAKRLRERESELLAQNAWLQSMADHYKGQAERLAIRARTLERTNRSLSERLNEANAARFYAEEEESSFPDPDRVEPITLECKVCERKRATVMMWPCRHICVCTRCDATVTYCPVCRVVKTNSIEVHLPLN